MKNTNFLLLYGYGWSGSGAILDLMKEIESITVSDTYFFLIRDSGGIIDLENNLLENWDVFRSSCAINNFLNLCERSKKPMLSPFTMPGRGYKSLFGSNFDHMINQYVKTISDFKYYSYEHTLNMSKGFIQCQISRLIHNMDKLGIKIPIPSQEEVYFAKPTSEIFYQATRKLISSIYGIKHLESRYLLIDHHPLPVHNFNKADDYFGKGTKMIVVDRDPRDIYVDLVNNRMRIGSELYRFDSVEKYIEWHKKTRIIKETDNLLRIRFEDAVLNYSDARKKILDFLEIDESEHTKKHTFFDPNISKNNIGIWKTFENGDKKQIFDKIINELKEYCYNEE